MERLSFEDVEIWESVLGLVLFAVAFYVAGYLVMRFIGKERYLPLVQVNRKEEG